MAIDEIETLADRFNVSRGRVIIWERTGERSALCVGNPSLMPLITSQPRTSALRHTRLGLVACNIGNMERLIDVNALVRAVLVSGPIAEDSQVSKRNRATVSLFAKTAA